MVVLRSVGPPGRIMVRRTGPIKSVVLARTALPSPPPSRHVRRHSLPRHLPCLFRERPDPGQRHPRARHGRGAGRQLRPPRRAHGHGRHGRCAVGPPPAPQPRQPGLGQPRPLRAVQRPRLHADLRAAAPDRLQAADRRTEELPPARQQDRRPPRSRPHARRRNDDRPAGPGPHQRGRHGAGREAAGVRIQPRRPCHRGSPHLRLPGRRLPDGRHQPRSHRPGRRLEAQQAGGPVRRQRHFHRRPGRALVHRRHAQAF